MISKEKTHVLIAGADGNLGKQVAWALLGDKEGRYNVLPYTTSNTSLGVNFEGYMDQGRGGHIEMEAYTFGSPAFAEKLLQDKEELGSFLVVDCTTIRQADVAEFYASVLVGLPTIIMGTIGLKNPENEKDLTALAEEHKDDNFTFSRVTNGAAAIAAILKALSTIPQESPNAFTGLRFLPGETHQAKKKDPSGTAKQVIDIFDRAGADTSAVLYSERDPSVQGGMWGVPPEHLDGHAYHKFTLVGEDQKITIMTEINGRKPYALGMRDVILPEIIRRLTEEPDKWQGSFVW
ncbi:hypothetical protein A2Y27_02235 [candidate division CPR2 bacterium GWD1_39_7]|nr:MAG: hypothetical protein UT59_C0015G0006 [candidate division CPR2 bacterium GW2011_GWD1_39_7]OGB61754.1 MAG: hypothetical protein A2Y27_02235 [candidate division CPR2 bacterium GWD1_39_7]